MEKAKDILCINTLHHHITVIYKKLLLLRFYPQNLSFPLLSFTFCASIIKRENEKPQGEL